MDSERVNALFCIAGIVLCGLAVSVPAVLIMEWLSGEWEEPGCTLEHDEWEKHREGRESFERRPKE